MMILICGPCVIENSTALEADAVGIMKIVQKYPDIDFYFKSSCVKDNRTSLRNYRGPGMAEGISYLVKIKNDLGIKITTDFHTSEQIKEFASAVDLIQIPAFLSMQTSLISEAVKIGKPIHIKKPQWLPPYDVSKPISKVRVQNHNIEVFMTDRGTTFGYGNVMFDPRHIRLMKNSVCDTVLVDITHLQNHSEIYDRSYSEQVGLAAIAAGADGLFIESTYEPDFARCDSDSMISTLNLDRYLEKFIKLYRFINA
jgi:2-dehydro-3-deoxyphosphooctonate aldolase (KDO 8-P synthase)